MEKWIVLFSTVVRMVETLLQMSLRYGRRYKRKRRKKGPPRQ